MLDRVYVPASIYHTILTHALSTEKEEIIGMLIGDWENEVTKNPFAPVRTVAKIEAVSVLTRSDKRKDRVEIAPEQLHLAALEAEQVGKELGKRMRVIGWYHSHPHITVFPSHVDLRTQLSQQYLDERFFGLIVSCFDVNSDLSHRIQITCFQAANGKDNNAECLNIRMEIVPQCTVPAIMRKRFLNLPRNMHEEHIHECETSLRRIQYESAENSVSTLMTQLYNAGVYGQSVTRLVDCVVCPATRILEMKAMDLDKEIEELKKRKEELQRRDKCLIEL